MANEGYGIINSHVNVQGDHKKDIREMGAKSTVLLKNVKNTLPLKKPKSIAVIGEDAHDNPGGPNACPDRGCDVGTLAMGWGSGTAQFPYLIAPNTALKEQATKDGSRYANVSNNFDFDAITKALQGTDVAIVFANADSGEAYINVDGNAGDRTNRKLSGKSNFLSLISRNNYLMMMHLKHAYTPKALPNTDEESTILTPTLISHTLAEWRCRHPACCLDPSKYCCSTSYRWRCHC